MGCNRASDGAAVVSRGRRPALRATKQYDWPLNYRRHQARVRARHCYANVAETNLREAAYGITSHDPRFGDVPNPLAGDRTAGGSSAGSAGRWTGSRSNG
jgi:hypothetical protein